VGKRAIGRGLKSGWEPYSGGGGQRNIEKPWFKKEKTWATKSGEMSNQGRA